jgi:hypothetical protein
MVPKDFHSPFLDSPYGLLLVLAAIIAGFYVFVGTKTPADYHRQGKELAHKAELKTKEMQNSQEAERNGEKGEKIEKVSRGV